MEKRTTLQKKQRTQKLRTGSAIVDKKISNSIKLVNKQSKLLAPIKNPLEPTYDDCFNNLLTFTNMPVKLGYIKESAADWIKTARETEILFLNEYHIQKGIPTYIWQSWIDKSPEMKEAQDVVRDIIAMRREKGAMQGKYNCNMVGKIQHVYDKQWKDAEEWRASLSAKNEAVAQQPIQVILERYPDSPLVPVKKVITE